MTATIFVDGAAGTTGIELLERLEGRIEFTVLALDEAQRKSEAARREAFHSADFAVLCLPDDAAREAVQLAEGSKVRIVDASSAHRTADGWTYGFPELTGREAVANATRVTNPGCYPTGFLGLVAPLIRAGLLPADWPYTVHAVSGYSGGGKALIGRFESDAGRGIAWRGYGLAQSHKHVAEMQKWAGLAHAPLFAPAVVQAFRGMAVEVPIPAALGLDADRARDALSAFFAAATLVRVGDHLPEGGELVLRTADAPSDALTLHVFGGAQGVRLIAMLDNLGKGASGAAVQSLNLMAGLDETAGLRL